MSSLSVDAQKRAQKDSAKKEAKAAAAEAKAKEAKDQAIVYIKRVERNKRKYVTEVSGLEGHGLELKKIAKEWGKKCESPSFVFFRSFTSAKFFAFRAAIFAPRRALYHAIAVFSRFVFISSSNLLSLLISSRLSLI